jgi:hypothetical protein
MLVVEFSFAQFLFLRLQQAEGIHIVSARDRGKYPALDLDLREGKAGIADSATEHCWKIRLRRQKNERLTAKATTDHRSPITVHWKLLGNLKQSV